MSNKDKTYCSLIDSNCIGYKRIDCKDCKPYKEAIKEAHKKTMEMLNKKFGIKEIPNQEQLP